MIRRPSISGIGIYGASGEPWGYSPGFAAQIHEVAQASAALEQAGLWNDISQSERESTALTLAGQPYCVRGMRSFGEQYGRGAHRHDLWAVGDSGEAFVSRLRFRGIDCVLVCVSNVRTFDPAVEALKSVGGSLTSDLLSAGEA